MKALSEKTTKEIDLFLGGRWERLRPVGLKDLIELVDNTIIVVNKQPAPLGGEPYHRLVEYKLQSEDAGDSGGVVAVRYLFNPRNFRGMSKKTMAATTFVRGELIRVADAETVASVQKMMDRDKSDQEAAAELAKKKERLEARRAEALAHEWVNPPSATGAGEEPRPIGTIVEEALAQAAQKANVVPCEAVPPQRSDSVVLHSMKGLLCDISDGDRQHRDDSKAALGRILAGVEAMVDEQVKTNRLLEKLLGVWGGK